MKTLLSSAAAAATLFAAVPAFSQSDDAKARIARRVDEVFARLDADKDGRISRAEAGEGPRLSKNFDRVDTDHDGYVTRAELSGAIERLARR
jgi:Ca2+-binding EF-hand superfamily protein